MSFYYGNDKVNNIIVSLVSSPKIIAQSMDISANIGDIITFSIEAEGENLTYKWYNKYAASSSFSEWNGKISASFSITADDTLDNLQAYCVVTDEYGNTAASNIITVHIIQNHVELSAPQIDISDTGLVTATVTQPSGYVDNSTKTAQKQIDVVELGSPEIQVSNTGLVTATVTQNTSGFVNSGSKQSQKQIDVVDVPTPQIDISDTGLVTSIVNQGTGFVNSGSKQSQKQIDVVELSSPEIQVSNTGLVTATVTQNTSGFVNSGSKQSQKQVTQVEMATPTISLNEDGLITVYTIQSAGFVTAGDKTVQKQITSQDEPDLIPECIISGHTIFGVSGSVVIQNFYTGTEEPSNSLGNDGDLYFVKEG